jgi:hypothetical protein
MIKMRMIEGGHTNGDNRDTPLVTQFWSLCGGKVGGAFFYALHYFCINFFS